MPVEFEEKNRTLYIYLQAIKCSLDLEANHELCKESMQLGGRKGATKEK